MGHGTGQAGVEGGGCTWGFRKIEKWLILRLGSVCFLGGPGMEAQLCTFLACCPSVSIVDETICSVELF